MLTLSVLLVQMWLFAWHRNNCLLKNSQNRAMCCAKFVYNATICTRERRKHWENWENSALCTSTILSKTSLVICHSAPVILTNISSLYIKELLSASVVW